MANVAEPDPREQDQFDFMNLLARHGLHDLANERWNAYGQMTYISSWQDSFYAKYTNLNGSPNSLLPEAARSFTGTMTLYFGLKTWKGGELYAAPELISERPLSDLKGLGGSIQNFELQKSGGEYPKVYRSRIYFKQDIGLGGEQLPVDSDPLQLGTTVDSRRITLRAGQFSILDFFDKNSYSGDLRRQFFNMAFLTYAAYDFAADARGYTWGLSGELDYDNWSIRYARTAAPVHPNQLQLNNHIFRYYGDQIELEHRHVIRDQPGAVRILGFRNHEFSGAFKDAINAYVANPADNATTCQSFNYDSANSQAPDLCWARKPNNKLGIGINLEQLLGDDVGYFFRGMYNDGRTEVYSYTSADRSISTGTLLSGHLWHRNQDTAGMGYGINWISAIHARYLGMGGIDGFVGDGRINHATEKVWDLFYSFNLYSSIWLTADYQHIWNPAFNADRGPVNIYGARVHVEF